MGAQCHGLGVLGTETLHDLGPQQTAGTHLGDFHEMVHTDGPEEAQARGKGIHVDTCVDTCTKVVHTISQGIGQLDVGRSTSLLHVVTRDGDAVELGHLL